MISPKVDCKAPIDTSSLKGKSVLVTGGADGIGAGTVRALAAAGAYVTCVDMNRAAGEKLEQELVAEGCKVKFAEANVTNWSSMVQAFKTAVLFSPHRSIDIVFPNAGLVDLSLFDRQDAQPSSLDIDPVEPSLRVYEVNLLAVVKTIYLAVHYFKLPPDQNSPKSGPKSIILTGSLVSYLDSLDVEGYGATKFAIRSLFTGLRHTLPTLYPNIPIRINMVAPTYVRTALTAPIQDLEQNGLKFVAVSDVVDGMMRLAADDSVNGRCIGISPYGNFDYCDDFSGSNGFEALQAFLETGALGPEALKIFRGVPAG